MDDDDGLTRRSLLAATAAAGAASTAGCAGVTTPAEMAEAASVPGNLGYFVGPVWLAEHRENVVVLDARSRQAYRSERVYGARLAPVDALTARRKTDAGSVPDAEALATALGEAGVAPDDDVVVYGASVGSRVTRVVFALEHLGHEGRVRVLNGGLDAWEGRIGTGDRAPDPETYRPDPQADTVVTRDWLAERVGSYNADDGPGLIDTRPPEAYLAAAGSAELVESNDRQGHLPGAVDVHWVGNVAGTRLTDPADLASLYFEGAGVTQDETVVVYGQGNVNPTNTWVVLRALGVEDVRLYDGGFREWANVPESLRGDCPVETKTTTVVETSGGVGGGDDGGFSCTG